jgi:FkbM family methyltransferase
VRLGRKKTVRFAKRALKRVLLAAAGERVYRVRSGLAVGLRRQGGIGFLPSFLRPLSREEELLEELDLTGLTVFDVGAGEGIFTLFFARAVGEHGRVEAFEPNPENVRRVLRNVELNGLRNVRVHELGLAAEQGERELTFDPVHPGEGTVFGPLAGRRRVRDTRAVRVSLERLDDVVGERGLPSPDLVKIDVEGLEYDALVGGRRTIEESRPALLIEMHGPHLDEKVRNAERMVGLLEELGYAPRHVERDVAVTPANAAVAASGHLYCARPA